MKKVIFAAALISVLAVMSVSAALDDARVRVIHASPDAPAVDVWANGAPLFVNAPFKGITDWKNVPSGTYDIEVVPAGATNPVVIDATLRLSRFRDYTVIATGNLADIQPLVLVDRTMAPSRKFAGIRFVHASPDAPAVDIAVKGGPVLFKNVEFREHTRYRWVMPGKYDLEVRVAGTDTVALEVPGVMLKPSTQYTAIAVGQLSDSSLGAVLAEDRQSKFA